MKQLVKKMPEQIPVLIAQPTVAWYSDGTASPMTFEPALIKTAEQNPKMKRMMFSTMKLSMKKTGIVTIAMIRLARSMLQRRPYCKIGFESMEPKVRPSTATVCKIVFL